ncbi:MAG TPA: hypothetical protein VGQ64_06425 [Candidatus Limnocylindrales bacterium]|nr:hypothetical protein [Candidatus Limnocylindrales bacterium]
MATKTLVCPECESPLAPGRFSCSSCGALVASVATAARPFAALEPVVPPVLTEIAPPNPAESAVPNTATPATDGVEAVPENWSEPASTNGFEAHDEADGWDNVAPAEPEWPVHPVWPPVRQTAIVEPVVPVEEKEFTELEAELEDPEDPEDSSEPEDSEADLVTSPAATRRRVRVAAGAHLPPSAVLPPGEELPLPPAVIPVMTAAQAAAWGGAPTPAPVASGAYVPAPVGLGTAGPAAAAPAAVGWAAITRAMGVDMDSIKIPGDLPARVVATGAGIGALGMIVPWAPIVIGSSTREGYFSVWGLAGPGHLIVLALLGGLAALALSTDRLPSWARPGIPSIAVGSLLVGLAWPYLFGSLGASLGIYAEVGAAALLIGAGILELATARHAEPPADV